MIAETHTNDRCILGSQNITSVDEYIAAHSCTKCPQIYFKFKNNLKDLANKLIDNFNYCPIKNNRIL